MRIYCNKCGSKALASRHENLSPESTEFYCQCLNAKDCGHRFAIGLEFSHTLAPAAEPVECVSSEESPGKRPKVYCKCGSRAVITKRDEISPEFTRLYCKCKRAQLCGHRFVMNLVLSRSLVPVAEPIDRMLFDRLRALPRPQARQMFEQLGISR